MINVPKIKIANDGCATSVEIDGVKQKGIRHVEFVSRVNDVPVVRIDYIAADMEIDCCAIPDLPEAFKPFYTLRDQ